MNNKKIVLALLIVFSVILFQYFLGTKQNEQILKRESELAKGIILYQQEKYIEAEEVIGQFKDSYYDRSSFYNLSYARVLNENEKNSEALKYYQKAYNIYPGYLREKAFVEEISRIEDLKQ